jgi:hypothetical protein
MPLLAECRISKGVKDIFLGQKVNSISLSCQVAALPSALGVSLIERFATGASVAFTATACRSRLSRGTCCARNRAPA